MNVTLDVSQRPDIGSGNDLALNRQKWIKRNRYYYRCLIDYLRHFIPENQSILEIGCGTGYVLHQLKPSVGVGIDKLPEMTAYARETYPDLTFCTMNASQLDLGDQTFDYIVISDTIGYFDDVQQVFSQLHAVCHPNTRVIITYTNFLWLPILNLAEKIGLKMPQQRQNWLDSSDITNLLDLAGLDVVRTGRKILMPRYLPLLSAFLNRYAANLPLLNYLGLSTYIVARSAYQARPADEYTVSVIVPARNELGNIEAIVNRTPAMGRHTEIIFVEGNSTDATWDEIQRVCTKYAGVRDLKCVQQDGKGKGDAVRKGFGMATGDILMILDADMTVPPEDLPKFYHAIASGKGEYINGSRLVYPMEKEAMRTLNLLGNKFFSIAFSWLLNQRIKDTLCGTKVLSKENYQRLIANRAYFGDFDPFGDFDLIFGSARLNLKFVEVPIRYRARTYGETNISRFKHGWLLLKMTFFALNKIKFV
ncbi:bifunctional class I SAM-dependent methyltransferase/glycosyltransferase family 2 protein [Nibrella saemangeumensis]|uniref:Bifunctional class I SAM-dependent methyltransferase/glycosyltransferase family 2 protein n=1 Tax=Nibrella saemangeumensis TaxID=1084526 RepID=A0ABP8N4X9_9BACT